MLDAENGPIEILFPPDERNKRTALWPANQSTMSLLVTPHAPPYRYQAWVDHLNSVIETAPLSARLDVPLLRREDTDPPIPSHHQQQQLAAGGRAGNAGGVVMSLRLHITVAVKTRAASAANTKGNALRSRVTPRQILS